jgi:hypothetical protein
MRANSSAKSPGDGRIALFLRGLLTTPFVTAMAGKSALPVIPDIQRQNVTDAEASSSTALESYTAKKQGCNDLFAAKEQAAWRKAQDATYSAYGAVKAKAKPCIERMGGNKDFDDWSDKSIVKWVAQKTWQEKEKACNALVDQQDDDVVKYIHALIDCKATTVEKLWIKLDMGRFDEGTTKCEDALEGRRTLMGRFKDLMPKGERGDGKSEL